MELGSLKEFKLTIKLGLSAFQAGPGAILEKNLYNSHNASRWLKIRERERERDTVTPYSHYIIIDCF